MTDFYFTVELESGVGVKTVVAKTEKEATEMLSKMFPDDVGADGTVEYILNGTDYCLPIDW